MVGNRRNLRSLGPCVSVAILLAGLAVGAKDTSSGVGDVSTMDCLYRDEKAQYIVITETNDEELVEVEEHEKILRQAGKNISITSDDSVNNEILKLENSYKLLYSIREDEKAEDTKEEDKLAKKNKLGESKAYIFHDGIGEFKSWMPASAITSRSSKQWKMKSMASVDKNGLLKVDGRYLVAVGAYFTREMGLFRQW